MATENRHDRARFQISRWCCVKVGHRGRITALTGQTRHQYIEHFEPIDDSAAVFTKILSTKIDLKS